MCAGRKDTSQENVGIRPTRGVGKERRARKARKDKGKARNPRKPTTRRKNACHNCNEVGQFARNCRKKKESNNASSSCGGDLHCLTYTDDQSQWIMMLAQVGLVVERSNDIEFLVYSGTACHAWPCWTTAGRQLDDSWFFLWGAFLTATGAPVASQGTLDVKFQFC